MKIAEIGKLLKELGLPTWPTRHYYLFETISKTKKAGFS